MRRSRSWIAAPFALALSLTLAQRLTAQSTRLVRANNSAYLEIVGNGGQASINFERAIGDRMGLRFGWGNWSDEESDDFAELKRSYNVWPIMLHGLLLSGQHHVELGGGVLLGNANVDSTLFAGSQSSSHSVADLEALIGYRRQPLGSGFVVRAGITPSYAMEGDYPDKGFHVGAGVSLGWAF
jgi:hypothetical protein